MTKETDIIPVKYRAKDRLPIDFSDGISIKHVLLDGPDGSSVIGHGLSHTVKDALDVIVELSGLNIPGYLTPVLYKENIKITSSTQTVLYNNALYYPNLSSLPFTTTVSFNTNKWTLLPSLAGAPGSRGPKGDQGIQGDQGIPGEIGLTGPQGIQGIDGGFVAKGDKGDKGDNGDKGDKGDKGDTGLTGSQGIQGVVGPESTVAGPRGAKGSTGLQGQIGPKGDQGIQGIQGIVGPAGLPGMSAYDIALSSGFVGTQEEWVAAVLAGGGATGGGYSAFQIAQQNGFTGTKIQWLESLVGAQGLPGPAGPQGAQGLPGTSGGSIANSVFYNNISRYCIDNLVGQSVWCVSSSTVYANLNWSRIGTLMTIYHPGHSKVFGDRVIIRNTNVKQLINLVLSRTIDSYTVTCENIGSLSGTAAAYSNGFTFSHDSVGSNITSGTLTAPMVSDLQLLSLRIHLKANTRAGLTYTLTIPSETIGVEENTNMDTIYVPVQQVRQDSDVLTAVGNTIATNIAGSYASFKFAALPAVASGMHILMQF